MESYRGFRSNFGLRACVASFSDIFWNYALKTLCFQRIIFFDSPPVLFLLMRDQYQINSLYPEADNLLDKKYFCQLLPERLVLSVIDGEGVSNDSFDVYGSAAWRHPIRLAHFGNRSQAIGFV